MGTRLGLSLVFVCLVIAFGVAQPAQPTAEIRGSVVDTSSAVLPGVRVSITGPLRRATVTNERGEFVFAQLVPGSYDVRAELAGFATTTVKLSLAEGASQRLTLRMTVAALQESVAVTADALSTKRQAGVAGHLQYIGPPPYLPGRYNPSFNTEAYDAIDENPFKRVATDAVSTFSIDVDTASYANVRRFLNNGALPPAGAVRIEELINYFRFDYPAAPSDRPFSVTTEVSDCPWNAAHRLALIGLRGKAVEGRETPPRNLVFLIDVSGSMDSPDKLPLVRHALRMLADTLTAHDRVAIVVYAGASGLALPSTPGDQKSTIQRAIMDLGAGGSTNGAAGIRLAYRVAREHFVRAGINRVLLATDGDFNVGVTSQDELVRLIEEERASGIFLSVLGVGTGNLKDSAMEKLADRGNGNYSYLDSLQEARKVLVREAGATLMTIAKDVKIQVEFNPATVAGYRLIGYENRLLAREDFNDDKKDAGEIGAGHSVTALYEIVPAGTPLDVPAVDPLKYQPSGQAKASAFSDELATVKLRYKAPDAETSQSIAQPIRVGHDAMSSNLGFASAVAEFGMLLRQSKHAGMGSFDSLITRARRYRGADPDGDRAEFVKLVELAASLRNIERPAR